jgi:Spy/CpxP family protein refolding chaperone
MTDPRGLPAVPHVAAHSRRTASFVMLALLAGGLAGGVLLDRFLLLPRRAAVSQSSRRTDDTRDSGARSGGWRGTGREGGGRGDMRRRFSERMTTELGLSPSQRERMDTIFAHQFAAMDSVTRTMRPSIDSIVKRAQRSVDSVLSDEQRRKLVELRKQRGARGSRGGPGGSGGPGGFGGPGSRGGPGRPDSSR